MFADHLLLRKRITALEEPIAQAKKDGVGAQTPEFKSATGKYKLFPRDFRLASYHPAEIVSALLEEMTAFWKSQEEALAATRKALRVAHEYLDHQASAGVCKGVGGKFAVLCRRWLCEH